ncbi:hypothetical protein AURDEDRAFT_122278 [Auricularia subglabra TFB-10046 SS5]|nr:hypothetical protein AURDEDRAFT_122278 [Auricularia subglabra TFB-10046 SS5]
MLLRVPSPFALSLSLRELMPAASLANPESKDDASTMPLPTPRPPSGTAPLSHLQDVRWVVLGLILALSLLSLASGLWLWLRFRRGDAARKRGGAVVLPSHVASAPPSEASTPGSASTFSLPSPPPQRILVLGSPPDAGGWMIQQKPEEEEARTRRASDESEIYAVDIANGRRTRAPAPGVLYFAGQRLRVLPARPVTPPPAPTIWVTPPGRSKWSPRR